MKTHVSEINVLLVEDNEDERLIIGDLLARGQHSKFNLHWVKDFDAGLKAISEGAYDVCLLDHSPGDRDGVAFIREAIQRGKRTPVILLTGRDHFGLDLQAVREGASDVLAKTDIDTALLERSVRYALERNKREEALHRLERLVEERTTELARAKEEAGRRVEQGRLDSAERTRAEEELEKLQAQFANALEMAHLGPWEYDVAKDLFIFNDHFYKIFHTTAEQVGKYAMSSAEYAGRFVHPGDISVVGEEIGKAINASDASFSRNLEHRMLYADGQVGYINVRFFIVKDANGQTVRTYGVNQDVTDRKQAEKERLEQERFFRTVLETTVDGFFVISAEDGRFTDVNDAYCAVSGYTRAQFLELGINDIEVEPPAETAHRMKCIIRNGSQIFETRHRKKDGSDFDVEVSVTYLHDDGGKFICFCRNITDRKRAEEMLRAERNFSNAVLDTEGALVGVLDPKGRIVRFNRACEKITGYTREEVAGKVFWDFLLTGDEKPGVVEAFKRLEAGQFPIEHENHWITKGGERVLISFSNTAIIGLDGAVEYIIGTGVDITQRKKAEEALETYASQLEALNKDLEKSNEKLKRLNKEMQEFVFFASHDLQEPVRKVHMFSDLLKNEQGALSEEQRSDYFDRMLDAAERMRAMIDDLLAYSRVTTRGQAFVKVGLSNPVSRALQILDLLIEETHARISVDDLPAVEADPSQMTQLFQNLIENALKFRREDRPPEIMIHSELVENDLARIMVEDNGIGFDEKNLERVFAPFERLHGKGNFKGTGIGLAICRKVVERHGGTITARSSPGKGSTFIIELPVKQMRENGRE